MGAYGAALALRDEAGRGDGVPPVRGIATLGTADAAFSERVCRADPGCHNECKLRVYDFGGRRSVWGGECGRYEVSRRRAAQTSSPAGATPSKPWGRAVVADPRHSYRVPPARSASRAPRNRLGRLLGALARRARLARVFSPPRTSEFPARALPR
jgi:hypothetical protein